MNGAVGIILDDGGISIPVPLGQLAERGAMCRGKVAMTV
jgi:hypothetical protein